MKNRWKFVNDAVEPPLFDLEASEITLRALVDHEDRTVVFVVQAVDPINDTLNALWSTGEVPLDRYLKKLHEAHRKFLEVLWDQSGPFA